MTTRKPPNQRIKVLSHRLAEGSTSSASLGASSSTTSGSYQDGAVFRAALCHLPSFPEGKGRSNMIKQCRAFGEKKLHSFKAQEFSVALKIIP